MNDEFDKREEVLKIVINNNLIVYRGEPNYEI